MSGVERRGVSRVETQGTDRQKGTVGLTISVLGSPRVEVDGNPLEVDTRKATALLIYLAVTGRPQSRDHLTGLLWPDYDQDRARAALRRTLSALRKSLADRWVSADRMGVRLDAGVADLDLAAFRARLDASARHDHDPASSCAACVDVLREAVNLFGGRFLHGFGLRDAEPFEEWQSLESESIERELHGALDRLVRALVAQGELEEAVSVAQRKLALDPLDEPAHRRLMQIYAWRGMRPAALQQYRECVAVLDRELGVSPLPETTSLYESIAAGAVETTEETQLDRPSPSEPSGPSQAPLPLRGRTKEWALMQDVLSGLGDAGALVVIEGEAGIGKTRLAGDFLVQAAERGGGVVSARAYEGESRLPYALVTQVVTQILKSAEGQDQDRSALSEVARLVPGALDDDSPIGSIEDPGGLTRFFEGVRRVLVSSLTGAGAGVVFLDDLHWCDNGSLDVLAYMCRRLSDTPLCIVAGWRTEQVDQDHPLRTMMAEVGRQGLGHHIHLARLARDDVRGVVSDFALVEAEEADGLADRLMTETEGIPFFVVEYLTLLAEPTSDWQMPASVKELLHHRVASVTQVARQVLGTAAVIDRSFDFDAVWRAAGRTELETLDALDELVARGLVTMSAADDRVAAAYEFSHDKLRSFVYDSMSPARRRVLHRRVAEAFIAAAKRQDLPGSAARIARHLELGGSESEAADYHLTAASRARAVYANGEALEHYLAAVALGHPDLAGLHEGAADMYVFMGEYKKAIDAYVAAAGHAQSAAIPGIEHKLGEVHLRRGDWELAQSHFALALDALQEDDDPETEARLLAAMSLNAYRQSRMDEAVGLAERALAAAHASANTRAVALALNQKGIIDNALSRLSEARTELEESLRLAEQLDDAGGRAAALNNLAHTARSEGDLDRALGLARRALAVCVQQGDSHREAALNNNIADLLHAQGDVDGAMEHLKQATTTLAKIGQEPSGMLPEVWKLVEW